VKEKRTRTKIRVDITFHGTEASPKFLEIQMDKAPQAAREAYRE
jgi:hypothetical protein